MKKFEVRYYFRNEVIKEEVEHVDCAALNHQITQQLETKNFLVFPRYDGGKFINVRSSDIYTFSVKELAKIDE